MALGDTLFTWLKYVGNHLKSVPPISSISDLFEQLAGALHGKPPDATRVALDTLGLIPNPATMAVALLLSSMTGKDTPPELKEIEAEAQRMMDNPSGYLALKLNQIQHSAEIQQAANEIASMVSQLVHEPLQALASSTEANPLLGFAELQAGMAAAKLIVHAVGVSAEVLGLGQIETVDTALQDLLKSFNLEEVSARMLNPLFASGIDPAAERFYNRLYRPERISVEQLIHLQALGLVPESYVQEEAAGEGLRDEDIEHVRQILYDRVSPGDILAARDIGQIGDAEALDRLQRKMLAPDDARFMLQLQSLQKFQGWGERVFQIALRNYLNYKIGDVELENIARQAGFPQERVDFEVRVAKITRSGQTVDISIGQVEQAFKAGQLSDVEAVNYLDKLQVDPGGIPVLLNTWKAQLDKSAAHLNVAQLTQAFKDGLLDDAMLLAKIEDLGFKPDQARLLVKIAEWQAPTAVRPLSEGMVVTAWRQQILDHDQAVANLVKLGYSEAEAGIILQADMLKPHVKARELSEAVIAKLFEIGEFSLEVALDRLENLGYSADDARLYLIAETTAKPKTTTTKPKPAKTPPTTQGAQA